MQSHREQHGKVLINKFKIIAEVDSVVKHMFLIYLAEYSFKRNGDL